MFVNSTVLTISVWRELKTRSASVSFLLQATLYHEDSRLISVLTLSILLAAGLRPDLPGELKCCPDPLAVIGWDSALAHFFVSDIRVYVKNRNKES